jgi:hypothetical protein
MGDKRGLCEVQVGQWVTYWTWEGLARVQRAGVVKRILFGCDGCVLRLEGGQHVSTKCLVRSHQLSLFGD